ncbi:MAG: InlB B-repeat-containing protein, partial [Finegoldia magna]|nr:InlB B-repeat-containing protein [Finegoldia magna]
MKKYKKNRVIFEEKVFDRKRKPVYGTRKLSVGLVSCMLGFMMFLPTSKASEEDIISTNQQVEYKNQVLDKTDDFADQEKEEVTPLNDQTDSKVDSEENLSDQNLDGQNREEDIIKEENSDSNLEDKDEELLTADEIQAIRDRANSLENDYFFNDNMVEELKAELRKAKADPSVNYEEAKARLIDEAIQKNAPDKEAPGEERAAVKVRKPTINPVSLESKTITGGNLEGSNKRKKLNKDCIIHVTVKDASGTIIETATTKIPPKGGSEWTVTLTKGLEAGYKVYAKQEFNGEFSDENSYEVKALLKDIHKDDLKMPSGQFWLEQTSSNIINDDEKAEALELLKKANPTIANDIESIDFKIYGIEDNKKASYIITYTDGSKTEEIQAPDLKIVPVTETSRGFTFDKVVVTNKSISGKLKGEGPFDNIKVHIVLNVSDQDTEFCKDGKCTITKNSSDPIEVKVNSDGTFSYDLKEGELSYNQKVGIFVKEIHKFKYCDKTTVMLASPEVTDVKDPRKLTQADKENIDAAIRKANTVGGASKLPEGSGDWDGLPAVIQFDENGNVKIFSGNDVAGTWDPNNDYKFVPETNEDGSYKLNDGAEAKITIPGKDLVKNIKPDAPEIKVNEDDKTKITINAKAVDTDANVITVSYTCSDDSSKTLKATKADDGTWSITEGEGSIDANGVVTLEVSKVKGGTNVTATVTDKGGIADDDKKALTSDQAEFKVTKATLVEALGGLDPVAIKKWVGDTVDWKDGVKAKDSATAENKVKIKEILDEATTKFTDETTPGRNTDARGDFKGTIKVAFDDGSIIEVKNQNLYVSDHVTSIKRDNTPSDALEVEFKLGEGTKVDNTSGGAIEGNKDNPTSYSKYKVKPGTDLKEYKLPSINTSVVDSINVTTQDTYTEPVWKDSKNGTNFVASTENKVFTATATKTYKVTLTANGGKGEDKVEVKKTGEKYKLPEKSTFNPPNKNQEFSGWVIGDGPGINKPGDEITVDGDKVIKAIWKPIEFKVTFQTEKGATGSMDPVTIKKGDEYVIPKPTFKPEEGKEFAGWKIEGQEGLKKAGERIDKISGDVTLIATWKDIMVNVTYNAGGGSGEMKGATIKKGSNYKLSSNEFTAPSNKKFKAWKIGEKEYAENAELPIEKDTEVIAIWEDIEYKVTFNGNGGS